MCRFVAVGHDDVDIGLAIEVARRRVGNMKAEPTDNVGRIVQDARLHVEGTETTHGE